MENKTKTLSDFDQKVLITYAKLGSLMATRTALQISQKRLRKILVDNGIDMAAKKSWRMQYGNGY